MSIFERALTVAMLVCIAIVAINWMGEEFYVLLALFDLLVGVIIGMTIFIDDKSDRLAGAELLYSGEGYYCVACECLCEMYDQGLSCNCGDPWETEVCDPDYYPDKWVRVKVEARRI